MNRIHGQLPRVFARSLIVLCMVLLPIVAFNNPAQAAVLFVSNSLSSGYGSLSQTILSAPSGAIIRFDGANCPCSYTLDATLTLDRPITILGMAPGMTIINGSGSAQLFTITATDVSLQNRNCSGRG